MTRRCSQVPLVQSMLPGHGGGASYYSAALMTRIVGLPSSKAWTLLWLLFYLLVAVVLFSQELAPDQKQLEKQREGAKIDAGT